MYLIRGITELKDYGKVEIRLRDLMLEKDITVYQMSKLADLKYSTVKAYYTNAPITRIDLDVIAKMCYVLDCKISDILKYYPPVQTPYNS